MKVAKKLLLLFCLILTVMHTNAQDVITRSDGVIIQATILDLKPNLISFKLFQQTDTLVYQISTQDVQSVRMADGTIKSFTQAASAKKETTVFNYEINSGRNILWLYPFEFLYSNITLAYERILSSGKVGFRIPLVFGLSGKSYDNYYDNYNAFRRNNRFGAGLDVNIYPFGQGRLRYFFGPAFQFRSYRSYYYYYDNTGSPPEPKQQNGTMYSLAIKNGIYYQFSKSFNISVDVGLGYRFFRETGLPDNIYRPEGRNRGYVPGNIHLGYRF